MRNSPREAKHPALSSFKTHDELAEWASGHPETEIAQIYYLARDYELREDDLVRVLAGRGQSNKGRITLTTCHKAKGREFPNVVVRDDFDQSLATAKRRGIAQLDEELNLLYVATTRAKQAVELQVSEIRLCPPRPPLPRQRPACCGLFIVLKSQVKTYDDSQPDVALLSTIKVALARYRSGPSFRNDDCRPFVAR